MSDLFRLDGQVAIVTGGNGRLGSQYAKALSAAGAAVAVVDCVAEPHQRIRELLAGGARVSNHIADVADRGAMEVTVDAIRRLFGTPTILINNAGLASSPATRRSRRVRSSAIPSRRGTR